MGNGCSSPSSDDILKFVQTQLTQNNPSTQPRQNNERYEQCEYTVTPIYRQSCQSPQSYQSPQSCQSPRQNQCNCNTIPIPQKIESLQFKLSFKPV